MGESFPQGIIDGFCTAITIGMVPTLFIILYQVGNIFSGYEKKNNGSSKTGSIIAIIFGLLFAFDESANK